MKIDEEHLEVKVTRIKNRWHARLYVGRVLRDEMACINRLDVGYICRQLLRWYDKNGGSSKYASRSRHRQKNQVGPVGKIWWNLLARRAN